MSSPGGMTEISVLDSFSSAISSLKEIVTIVTGLAVTNAIIQLMVHNITIKDNKLSYEYGFIELNIITIALFIIVLLNVIRFYHGNIRHLDDLKLRRDSKISINFFIIFIENILFAALSFNIQAPNDFSIIFFILILLDMLWIIWFQSFPNLTLSPKTIERRNKWTINNIIFIGLMGLSYFFGYLINDQKIYLCLLLLYGNTIVDLYIMRNFYFPKPI